MRDGGGLRSLVVIPVVVLLTACGGGGGGKSTAVDPNAPVLANLRTSFGGTCTLNGPTGRVTGTGATTVFDYSDADGDVRGGTVELVGTFAAGGAVTLTGNIPSPGVGITGTTAGTITVATCVFFGPNSSFTDQVKVTDASGKVSNVLTLEVARPGGVPLLPHSDQTSLGAWGLKP